MQIINDDILDKKREKKLKRIIDEIMQVKDMQEYTKNLKGLKIIKGDILHKDISASIRDDYIIIPITKVENILEDNESVNILKSNILHEICHIKLEKILPEIHEKHKQAYNKEDFITAFTIIIYVEYLAHLESSKYETEKMIEQYFESINNYNWDFLQDISKIYLVKHAGYIIGRAKDKRMIYKDYINNLENYELKEQIIKIQNILESVGIVDDYNKLLPIEKIVRLYITN